MFIDPNDAVLHELKRIADGVSKPAPNAWLDSLKTLATFILGLATAFLSQRLQAWLADASHLRALLGVLESEA